MSSTPAYQRLMLPQTGVVSPNSAIVLDAHVVGLGRLGVTAHVRANAIDVRYEIAPPFSIDRFVPGGGARYLVRPTTGDWPRGATVRLTIENGPSTVEIDVPIGESPDVTPPTFSSLSPPTLRMFSSPGRTTEVTAIAHGAFEDPASPLVLVDLACGHQALRFAVIEGRSGTLLLDAEDNALPIDALTLTDVAGNARRIESPCGPPPPHVGPFVCIAGSIESEGDALIATSDAGTNYGFSRGHYLSRHFIDGDIEISVDAERLTDEHEMPIEIAFRGGFFAVTGTSSWFLYEHDRHWTGWQPTPVAVGPGVVSLRVVQRGQHVTGYIDGRLLGSFTLQNTAQGRAVGLAFKARPSSLGRVRFTNFVVRGAALGGDGDGGRDDAEHAEEAPREGPGRGGRHPARRAVAVAGPMSAAHHHGVDDTSPAASRFYYEHLRALSPRERLEIAARLSMAVRRLAEAGVRRRHPTASGAEVTAHVAASMYGRQVVERVLGELPAEVR